MATPQPMFDADERLPLILGFQKISDNTAPITRVIDRGEGIYVYDTDLAHSTHQPIAAPSVERLRM
ncbi:MAG: hypothetical protein AAF384_09795 [Pseudomonadota bacterium]